ncbi:hypothetical protein TCAL_04495 [Tigriopus californicus]|uniref:MARVEL domain-containing protein n=1 Tax=Tigriopus californicus TaxID=6832 RepID=A0A553P084_TIGCA|nr:hypothetical protein TCAL_04495 [Tigriopus californicus]
MITRLGGPGTSLLEMGAKNDANAFGYMVVFGYFFIVIVQTIGLVFSEEITIQNLIYTTFGALFFMSVGLTQVISSPKDNATRIAHGSLTIIVSLVFLVDCGFTFWKARKERV